MMRPRLRIFTGEEDVATLPEPAVNIPFAEFTQILTDASRTDRTWLQDFAEDEIGVSPDLYEVLCANRHLRPSA